MVTRDLVVVGASAGGVEALQSLLASVPADLPAAVLVVVHRTRSGPSALPQVLGRAGALPAAAARDGQRIEPGTIWVAVPDCHLVVHDGSMALRASPPENRHRPAIDPLLRSASRWYGPRVVAVVLSGALDDGAVGAAVVHGRRGVVLVQDPAEALIASMPLAVAAAVPDAHVAPAGELGRLLVELTGEAVDDDIDGPSAELIWETDVTLENARATPGTSGHGTPVGVGCPDCSGGMFEYRTGQVLHYRCHTGHAWSPQTLVDAEHEAAESGLLAAAAKLREEAVVLRRAAEHLDGRARQVTLSRAEDADRRAWEAQRLLRRIALPTG